MAGYFKQIEIRWSDLDPNFHLRHSAYYDFGGYCRISFMNEHQLGLSQMAALNIGPVLFREECVFKREIKFGDTIKINLTLEKATPDFSRWTMKHDIWKNEDTLAAVITVDGAWMDTSKRKLTIPPASFKEIFSIVTKNDVT